MRVTLRHRADAVGRRSLAVWVVVLATLVTLGSPARAQEGPAGPDEIKKWEAQLTKVAGILEKGGERRASKALDSCLELYDQMIGRLGQGDSARRLLGETLFLLAVAQARLEDQDVAVWRWIEAQSILPDLRSGRLSAFPDVASLLEKHVISDEERERVLAAAASRPEGYRSPVPAGMAPISYPGGARRSGIQGSTEVVVVVNEEGLPVRPVLRESSGVPGFDVAVMETARMWTFAPAYQDGRAVTGSYVLSARFNLGTGG